MDAAQYHRLKMQELELQTRLAEVKRQLVNMEWKEYLYKYLVRTPSPELIPDDYDEIAARDIV